MSDQPLRETYTITLEALPDGDRPAVIRLRQLLKIALRGLRLKCITARAVTGEEVTHG